VAEQPLQAFYRIVKTDPPTLADFLSLKALGRPLRHPTARALRLWDGLSVYQTAEQACALAGASPSLGGYIAELRIPASGPIQYELDTGRFGHCTLWGDPADIMNLVVSVVRV
jgi:hypothetical protein